MWSGERHWVLRDSSGFPERVEGVQLRLAEFETVDFGLLGFRWA